MTFEADHHRWGLIRASYGAVMRFLASRLGVHVFLIHRRPLRNAAPAGRLPADQKIRYLTPDDIERLSADPKLEISADAAAAALDRGDLCIGYFDRGRLVSYFWSGFDAVPMEDGLWARVPDRHACAYKALTLAAYRGRHLQRFLLEANDRELIQRGLTYNVTWVAPHNFAQRAASARHGNVVIGIAGYTRWGKRVMPFCSRRVRACGFEFYQPSR